MAFSLLPDLILDAVPEITPALLRTRGVRFLMMDFDNTIVPYTTDVPEKSVTDWIAGLQSAGITVCMVSNSHKPRVREFCEKYGVPCIQGARKPFWAHGIRRALRAFSCSPAEAALVGDQIYTDVLGGNGAGVQTILVRPILLSNFWLRLRNLAEQPFIRLGKRRQKT